MTKLNLHETLTDYYKKQDKVIRPLTIKNYVLKLNQIFKLIDSDNDIIIFLDFENIKINLEKIYSNSNTVSLFISAIIVLLRACEVEEAIIKPYNDWLLELRLKINNLQKNKIENEIIKMTNTKMKNVKMKYNYKFLLKNNFEKENLELNEKEKMDPDETEYMKDILIYCFYNGEFVPPCRLDINKILIVDKFEEGMSKDFNFLCLTTGCIVYRNYKTSSKYGDRVVKLPSKLIKILENITPLISHNNFLLVKADGHLLTAQQLGKRIYKIFGCTCCDLRKFYLSKKYKKLQKVLDELKQDTYGMLNSPSEALRSYIYQN